jgi:hypothetical protein
MNQRYIDDTIKKIKQTPLNQELPPGSPRRYEPQGGVNNHNARIHRESEVSDRKNLEFNFRKPHKPVGRSAYVKCDNCGYVTGGTTATAGIICPECKEFSTVSEVGDE